MFSPSLTFTIVLNRSVNTLLNTHFFSRIVMIHVVVANLLFWKIKNVFTKKKTIILEGIWAKKVITRFGDLRTHSLIHGQTDNIMPPAVVHETQSQTLYKHCYTAVYSGTTSGGGIKI